MVKFDANPSRTMIKQVSTSSPSYASGGDYNTPKQGVHPKKSGVIVDPGGPGADWAKGGGTTNIGGEAVKAVKPC